MTENRKKHIKLWCFHIVGFVLFLGALAVLYALDLPFCPLKLIFKISCPFCGMTRAHIAALQLDFASAFSYHPVFPLGIPFIWLLCHEHFFRKSRGGRVAYIALTASAATAIIITYILRVALYGFAFC